MHIIFLLIIVTITKLEGLVIHNESFQGMWERHDLPLFDELIISWNGPRPIDDLCDIHVSVKVGEWTEWLPYASWGTTGQTSYSTVATGAPVKIFQDTLSVLNKQKASGFRVKATGTINRFHVYINSDHSAETPTTFTREIPIQIPVQGISQMTLRHPRAKDLCSPASTAAVVNYLKKNNPVNPVTFANGVWDSGFDIYGNWVFNVAQASVELGPTRSVWVERLKDFNVICTYLEKDIPVIVSVRGPLQGSALPYASGHLMVVIGYDPSTQEVICMDPAFPLESKTHVRYETADFINAWNRRGRIAYVFEISGRE